MGKVFWGAGAVMATALAMSGVPAAAATTINFAGSNSALDGADGNTRNFSGGGINVTVSGWEAGSTLEPAFLGRYGTGLGVTNNNEGNGSSNRHTADNKDELDFFLLVFDQAVNISSAVLTPYGIGGTSADNDAFVSAALVPGAYGSTITPASSFWSTLASNAWTVPGNTLAPYSVNLNSSGVFANVWVIGATYSNPDQRFDAFKLRSVTVDAAVPEPGTWAMMLIGFGAIGTAMRRARRATPKLRAA